MKKKYTLVILSLFLLGMTGCGNKQTASVIEEPAVIESTVVEETTEIESTVAEEPTEIESTVVEETTETVMTEEISTDISTDVSAEVEPYIMYTNTNCNIRSEASADSDVIGLYDINVEVEVIGEENGWSKLEYDGCIAYIKSSLLSKTQTATKGSSSGSGKSSTTQPQTQSTPQQSASSQNFPADVASSKYLSRFLNKGYDNDTIIFLVREAEECGMAEDDSQNSNPMRELTPEEIAANAELSEGVVVE